MQQSRVRQLVVDETDTDECEAREEGNRCSKDCIVVLRPISHGVDPQCSSCSRKQQKFGHELRREEDDDLAPTCAHPHRL
eukprot:4490441-Prymnesium_polylepis.1